MKGFLKGIRIVCLTGVGCLLGALSGMAATPPAPAFSGTVLPEVVVTATRTQEAVAKVPADVTVITEQEIRDSGATTLIELLERQEGVYVRSVSGQDPLAVVDLRGMGGDNPFGKVQIQLNGRRLNRPDMSPINWLQLPLGQIERIEIIRGPGAVLHGDSAVAGVINVITKRGEGKPQFRVAATAGRYGLHSEQVGVSGSEGRWSYSLSGGNHFSLGYRKRSTVLSQSAGLDLGYDATDRLSLALAASFGRTRYELPGNLTAAEMAVDRRQYQPARPLYWTLASSDDDTTDRQSDVKLRADWLLGAAGRLEIGLAMGKKEVSMDMVSWNAFNDYTLETYAVTPQYVLERPIFGRANKFTTGIDYYVEPFTLDRYASRERTAKVGVADMERRTVGWYLRDEIQLWDPVFLSLGYRREEAAISGQSLTLPATVDFDAKKTHRGDAFEAGMTYRIGDGSKVFAKFATAFRLPFLDEQASYYGWGNTFLPNLEKETAKTAEIGASLKPLPELTLNVTVFRIDMKNEIVWNPATFRNENLDQTRHDGLEASVAYRWADILKVQAGFTYHLATFENGPNQGKEIPLVPNYMAKLGLEWSLPGNIVLRPEARYVGSAYLSGDNDNTGEKLDSYWIYDLFAFYRARWQEYRLSAFAGIENLTDERYATVGVKGTAFSPQTYYPQPGRTWKCGLSLEF